MRHFGLIEIVDGGRFGLLMDHGVDMKVFMHVRCLTGTQLVEDIQLR